MSDVSIVFLPDETDSAGRGLVTLRAKGDVAEGGMFLAGEQISAIKIYGDARKGEDVRIDFDDALHVMA